MPQALLEHDVAKRGVLMLAPNPGDSPIGYEPDPNAST
jgi:hypothetical protein